MENRASWAGLAPLTSETLENECGQRYWEPRESLLEVAQHVMAGTGNRSDSGEPTQESVCWTLRLATKMPTQTPQEN